MPEMKALRAHARGGPEVLVYEAAARPRPDVGEVLVAVHAAGITFAELGWDETWTRKGKDRTPIIPSHEFSGVVAEVGDSVLDLAVGDRVYGLVRFDQDGAAADYVAVPAGDVAIKPTKLSHVEAAALPLAALTAWQALVDHAHVHRDERVLVHGGAGGVGAFVVQIALALGARVTATSLGADVDFVRGLGADSVINVEVEEFDSSDASFDVVIDTVGGATLDRSFAVLGDGGRLITLQQPPSQVKAEAYGVTAIFFIVIPSSDELARIAELADADKLRVNIAGTFELSNGRAAYESGTSWRRRPGKTVLVVRS